jgi:thioredoxin 1
MWHCTRLRCTRRGAATIDHSQQRSLTSAFQEKTIMAGANTLEFTDANFQSDVLESKVPVLIDFWAEWCGPCRALGPTIDELANDYQGKAKIGKLNVDSARDTAMKFQIQSIPTVVIMKNGQVHKKLIGLVSKSVLSGAIDSAI